MRPEERISAQRHLDKRLNDLRKAEAFMPPPRGWIKAIREALGMTTEQLSRRLGVVQSRVVAIEKAETTGSITLDTLERTARALDCRLVYAIVPNKPLEDTVKERARLLAKKRLEIASHSMKLEAQVVDARDESEQLESLTNKIIAQSGSRMWEDI